ncbi:MAG: hypothetical protein ACI944_001613 [Natronomonas sp.]|jgi:hypothetical protein
MKEKTQTPLFPELSMRGKMGGSEYINENQ